MTLQSFVETNRIHMTVERINSNPHMSDMPRGSSHWKCILRRDGRRLTIPFSQGPAISNEPTATDVLECLASDYATSENTFDDWCREMGFNMDSRKAEQVYKAVEKQSRKLERFLGPELLNDLVYGVEL